MCAILHLLCAPVRAGCQLATRCPLAVRGSLRSSLCSRAVQKSVLSSLIATHHPKPGASMALANARICVSGTQSVSRKEMEAKILRAGGHFAKTCSGK